jgi:hypothetical protein
MAGTSSAFDAANFRTSIKAAMNMGLPVPTALRPTFRFKEEKAFPVDTLLDDDGYPFDPSIEPVVTSPAPILVDCAVEITKAEPSELPVGAIRRLKATLTILDTDYARIKDAYEVDLGGDAYTIETVLPPYGLFDVTIYQLICVSKEEE